jgi:hypothetical protein
MGAGAALAAFCAGCAPAAALRRLEADNAMLRARLDGDNEVREALLAACQEERVAVEIACVADRVSMDEIEYCPEFEACMQDCLTAGADMEGCYDDEPAGD